MEPDRPLDPPSPVADAERSERSSFWVALAIALAPIPAALLIAWALGDLPWRDRPPGGAPASIDPADHVGPDPHR